MSTIIRACFFVISILSFFNEIHAQGNYKITGSTNHSLNGAEISFEKISQWKENFNRDLITTKVENDSFVLKGKLLHAFEYCALSIKLNGNKNSYSFFVGSQTNMRLYIDKISTEESDKNIRYTNIPFDKENREFIQFTKDAEKILFDTYKAHSEFVQKNANTKFFIDSLIDSVHEAKVNWMHSNLMFINPHLDSYVSLYNFNKEFVDFPKVYIHPDSLLQIYSMFTSELKETALGQKAYSQILKKQHLLAGNKIPNFDLIANDSLRSNLYQYKNNNNVLLCFWASWCLPCIQNIPFLKTIDSIYTPLGLKLISVSVDKDESWWKDALGKYNMPWLQVRDVLPGNESTKIQTHLDIDKIPQYFLISKDMELLYRSSDLRDADHSILLKKLAGIFGK